MRPKYVGRTAQVLANVRESVATVVRERANAPVRRAATEAPTLIGEAAGRPGEVLVQLIKAGWSLNGNFYPASVLERDGPSAWASGTLNYVDHDTDTEEEARPAGSLQRLASYQTSDARWDEQRQALVATVRPFAPWREAVLDWARSGAVGMSIRAWLYGEEGEAEGQRGFIVSGIPQGRSCDYVTVPAAGGALLSVLESVQTRAATEARNVGAWLESRLHLALTQLADDMYGDGRLTREERIVLSSAVGEGLAAWTSRVEADAPQLFQRDLYTYPEPAPTAAEEQRRTAEAATEQTRAALDRALRAAYAADDTYVWVRDFDPDAGLVWFDISGDGESATWQQGYAPAGDSNALALTGERTQVSARTVYEPVPAGDEPDGAADEAPADPAPQATPTAVAVTENVTDGAPPTAPNPPIEEEPVSGTQTGAPPVQAGTATVVDTPPEATITPPTPAPAVQEVAQPDAQTVAALESVTARLAETQKALVALNARADQRDAENRALRNTSRASEAVAAALRAPEFADVAAQIGARVSARVLASVPTTAEGVVDEAKLTEVIAAAAGDEAAYLRNSRAEALEEAGVGLPRGLGSASTAEADDGFDAEMGDFFTGTLGLDAEQAKIATRGRGN
jgi:hypothetical protein